MTEAGWTRDKPKEAGWYWWRQEKGMMEVPREVVYSPFYRGLVTQGERLIAGDGEWLGPITPDSYQQGRVAGLREAAEMVEDDCYIEGGELLPDYEHRCKHNVNQNELAGKIRFRANDLAQQAQEGGVGDAER